MCRCISIVLLTVITLLPAVSSAKSAAPGVPEAIAVPAGHRLLFKLEARGVQIYKAVDGESGKFKWVLDAPLADLFNGEVMAGHHYGSPPSWEAADGSKVVRSGGVKSAPAPHPKSDIPWLLVQVKAADGQPGAFSPVDYIQRLRTRDGKAPAWLPRRGGTKVAAAYRAVYYFYGKAN